MCVVLAFQILFFLTALLPLFSLNTCYCSSPNFVHWHSILLAPSPYIPHSHSLHWHQKFNICNLYLLLVATFKDGTDQHTFLDCACMCMGYKPTTKEQTHTKNGGIYIYRSIYIMWSKTTSGRREKNKRQQLMSTSRMAEVILLV